MKLRWSSKPMLEWDTNDVPGFIYATLIRHDGRVQEMAWREELMNVPGGRDLVAADLWAMRKNLRDDPARREG